MKSTFLLNIKLKYFLLFALFILAATIFQQHFFNFFTVKMLGSVVWSAPERVVGSDLILVSPYQVYDPKKRAVPKVYLINLNGKIIKEWSVNGVSSSSRLGKGGLLFTLIATSANRKQLNNGGESDKIVAVNERNEEVFSIPLPESSHDFAFVEDGKIAALRFERIGHDDIKKFFKSTDKEFAYSDRITVTDYKGIETWSWSLKDHIQKVKFRAANENLSFVSNANSIQYVNENPLSKKPAFLVSFRNIDLLLLIEYPSGNILWQSPVGELSRQHDATIAQNNILVFDNQIRVEEPSLQILEWDILSDKKVFHWSPTKTAALTTTTMGGVRRLRNGSILISISNLGQLLEVDQNGLIKWSFLIFTQDENHSRWPLGQSFFRAEVYSPSEIKALGFSINP